MPQFAGDATRSVSQADLKFSISMWPDTDQLRISDHPHRDCEWISSFSPRNNPRVAIRGWRGSFDSRANTKLKISFCGRGLSLRRFCWWHTFPRRILVSCNLRITDGKDVVAKELILVTAPTPLHLPAIYFTHSPLFSINQNIIKLSRWR